MDNTRVIGVEAGKIPPQAVDMEEAVLGAVMLEKDAIYEVIELLKPECFYKEAQPSKIGRFRKPDSPSRFGGQIAPRQASGSGLEHGQRGS